MIRVALLLFDEVDLIDLSGPYEVLLTANRLAGRRGEPPPFDVVTTSHSGAAVTAFGGLGLVPDRGLDGLGDLDVLVVPGAIDVDGVLDDQRRGEGTPDRPASRVLDLPGRCSNVHGHLERLHTLNAAVPLSLDRGGR